MLIDTQTYADNVINETIVGRAQSLASMKPKSEAEAMATAKDFEAVFLTQMLTPIFESLPTDGPMGGGSGEKIFRSLMVQEYGKSLAESGGVGISDAVYREIMKLQEV
ncbi:rod-binding protein [Kiloniella sp. EL199]|uniref:rod-binding protein n=1 Tax=Kiloniella sp. EL199 TaxID=2107581 RepID=UPI000EA20226|nr:rod-binding protein [Kiloniella sp. EL199]